LSDIASKESRAAAYRLLRYTLVPANFNDFELDWYIVRYVPRPTIALSPYLSLIRTMVRDSKHHIEKEQAILLIRSLINSGSTNPERQSGTDRGRVPLSEPIMRAMIAVAEQPEEPFRGICLVTLTEIRMYCP